MIRALRLTFSWNSKSCQVVHPDLISCLNSWLRGHWTYSTFCSSSKCRDCQIALLFEVPHCYGNASSPATICASLFSSISRLTTVLSRFQLNHQLNWLWYSCSNSVVPCVCETARASPAWHCSLRKAVCTPDSALVQWVCCLHRLRTCSSTWVNHSTSYFKHRMCLDTWCLRAGSLSISCGNGSESLCRGPSCGCAISSCFAWSCWLMMKGSYSNWWDLFSSSWQSDRSIRFTAQSSSVRTSSLHLSCSTDSNPSFRILATPVSHFGVWLSLSFAEMCGSD